MKKSIKLLSVSITHKLEGTKITLILNEAKTLALLRSKKKSGEKNLKIEISSLANLSVESATPVIMNCINVTQAIDENNRPTKVYSMIRYNTGQYIGWRIVAVFKISYKKGNSPVKNS